MLKVANILYHDLCKRSAEKPLNFSLNTEEIECPKKKLYQALYQKVAKDLGVKNPENYKPSIEKKSFSLSPLSWKELKIPPIFFMDIKNIPPKYRIEDENDPRIHDREFLRETVQFFYKYFKENYGIEFDGPSVLDREISGCELLAVSRMLQDKTKAVKILQFFIRKQIVDESTHLQLKQCLIGWFSVALAFAAAISVFIFMPADAFLKTGAAFATFYAIDSIFLKVIGNPVVRHTRLEALRNTVRGREDLIEASQALSEHTTTFEKTLATRTDPDVRDVFAAASHDLENNPCHIGKEAKAKILSEERERIRQEPYVVAKTLKDLVG